MPQLWDKTAVETAKAFEAFITYRDMGADRSLTKTALAMGKVEHYRTQLGEWSAEHEWVARCHAYDAWTDRLRQKEHARDIIKMRERHARLAMNAQTVLSLPMQALTKKMQADPAALEKELSGLKGQELVVLCADLIRQMPSLMKAEMVARGEATELYDGQVVTIPGHPQAADQARNQPCVIVEEYAEAIGAAFNLTKTEDNEE